MKTFLGLAALLALAWLIESAYSSEHFIEAETFQSSDGWAAEAGPLARDASGVAFLSGSGGAADGIATATVSIKDAGRYHLWVRYSSHSTYRGPFRVSALAGERELGGGLFDAEFEGKDADDKETWRSFEINLPEGEVTLRLGKHENKNCSYVARLVDCLLLTMDARLVPNHQHFGAQTYVRVTLGEGYSRPVYLHIFADHFHAPWTLHYALGRDGAIEGTDAKAEARLTSGERTPWCNLTPMIYQDSGAMLFITARHTYWDSEPRLRATLEFATAPDEKAIVRTLKLDRQPGTAAVFMPPNLLTPENLALCKTDQEIAEASGKLADAHPWPTHGRALEKFPFFISEATENRYTPFDAAVYAREKKTLGYFGFTPEFPRHVTIVGAWGQMKNGSYCDPDVEKMKPVFARHADEFKKAGGTARDIVFCELADEPGGQPLEFMAKDAAYATRFHAWLKALGTTPADLLVQDWDAVRIVTVAQRDAFPALYYFSQRFRSRALGDFIATQRRLAEEAFGGTFPALANFSDGAVYGGNFCVQGVDYFEVLAAPDHNAIWSEDWLNGASTYQCGAFNVDLMRAAARERGQIIGDHLIASAERTPWDVKLKATSELARGVKILQSFSYGPSWATHEGGPWWRSNVWLARPETWTPYAALVREVGAAEDTLLTAMPAPAQVALLYSSSSDAWTIGDNLACGFDRMHTWLALAHAQMPVDILAERQIERGLLDGYSVCYLSGPNLTRASAEKLKAWVQRGGTLWLTAGAASRDEFNRPLDTLDELLPASRGELRDLQKQTGSGRYLPALTAKDEVRWADGTAEVLALKQSLTAHDGAEVLGAFKDKSPALVRGTAGKGAVYCAGFLPALAYIKTALDARNALQKKVADKTALTAAETNEAALLERTANPWQFPAALRDLILTPVRAAKVAPPIACDAPLVDAVFMPHESGILIPLANYTAAPIERLTLNVTVPRSIARAESAVRGKVSFQQTSPQTVELSLPLANNDFVKLYFQ